MNFKGWHITKQLLPGADFKIDSSGQVVNRTPKQEDIDYYQASKDGLTVRESTLPVLKKEIVRIEKL